MTGFTFCLLLVVLGWLAVVQLLNANSKAGELARQLFQGIIEKTVGRQKETPSVPDTGTNSIDEKR